MRSTHSTEAISVIDRVTLVLECFRPSDRRLGVSELARRANLPKSTVSRLVSELIDHRYLEREGSGVRLGLRLFELGELAAQPKSLRTLALETMVDLRDAIGETVQLVVLDGSDVLCLGVLHAGHTMAAMPRVGGRVPAHSTAAGRVLLAFCGPDALARTMPAGSTGAAPTTLHNDLARIREVGVAYDLDPETSRATGVAGVILAADGSPRAAIAALGVAGEFAADRIAPAVRTAALGLSGHQALV
jgi:IclR family acetate operon transcriptional repressor